MASHGFRQPPLLLQRDPQITMGLGEVRFNCDCPPYKLNGSFMIASLMLDHAKQVMCIGVIRMSRDYIAINLCSLV